MDAQEPQIYFELNNIPKASTASSVPLSANHVTTKAEEALSAKLDRTNELLALIADALQRMANGR